MTAVRPRRACTQPVTPPDTTSHHSGNTTSQSARARWPLTDLALAGQLQLWRVCRPGAAATKPPSAELEWVWQTAVPERQVQTLLCSTTINNRLCCCFYLSFPVFLVLCEKKNRHEPENMLYYVWGTWIVNIEDRKKMNAFPIINKSKNNNNKYGSRFNGCIIGILPGLDLNLRDRAR